MERLFADVPEVFLRLGAAVFLGILMGTDRELRGKAAGIRTHALVALGAALATLLGIRIAAVEGGLDPNAVSRVIQGILAGIGFLGGGAILKAGNDIRGLTTAASIFVVAAIGIACGAGEWLMAIIAVFLAVMLLVFGVVFERLIRQLLGPWSDRATRREPDQPK